MKPFLTGEWRWLAMLNWRVDPALLASYVPRGTVLDQWHGATFVSVVGFLFRDTRLLGVPIPLHRDFEEVNLRFYVRREARETGDAGGEPRRAVTFIREIVPRRAIATVARLAYNEPYVALPMSHEIGMHIGRDDAPATVEYAWRHRGAWSRLRIRPVGDVRAIADGSEEEFITEHYWGYTRQRDGGTVEYQVTHPRWRVWSASEATLSGNVAALYGAQWAPILASPPSSAFLAEGSAIAVGMPRRIA